MKELFLVASGGAIGALARYIAGNAIILLMGKSDFPYGTVLVNVAGCLIIGFLGGLFEIRNVLNPEIRLFLFIGILGGFTTFSTFGYETIQLMLRGLHFNAFMNIFISIIAGVGSVYIGFLASLLFRK